MYRLFIKEVGGSSSIQITFDSDQKLKNFVRNISTLDLEKKEYRFLKTKESEALFEKTYKEEFYTITGMGIKLNKMPNGIKREKSYPRKSKYNHRILDKTLNKISEQLSRKEIYLTKGRYELSRIHNITLVKKEDDKNVGYALMSFDKLLWEYKIDFVKAPEPREFIFAIHDAFDKYTKSTRRLRRRLYANNP